MKKKDKKSLKVQTHTDREQGRTGAEETQR